MKTTIYREIVSRCIARRNCEDKQKEWYDNHAVAIQWLQDSHLPRGSGIDSGCQIDTSRTDENRLIIESSFHVMDENGFYDGWIDFTVTVKPSLLSGIVLTIKGNFNSRKSTSGLKDYLHEEFDVALSFEIDTDDMKYLFD